MANIRDQCSWVHSGEPAKATDKAGLTLTVDTPGLSQPAYVDRDMWEKIVLNLLSNAFKYTLEGGVAVTLAASALYFGYTATFSYVEFRLEAGPFFVPPAATSLIFLLWLFGFVGPPAGRLAERIGWRPIARAAMATALTPCSGAPPAWLATPCTRMRSRWPPVAPMVSLSVAPPAKLKASRGLPRVRKRA